MRFRRLSPFAFVLVLLILPIFASGAIAAPAGKQVQVSVLDYKFDPATVTVNAGDTVVWTNNGAVAHTVTASDGSWDSGNLSPGQSFSHTFNSAGTVAYYCAFHGSASGSGMAGTVMIVAAADGSAATAVATQSPAPTQTSQPAAQPSAGAASIDVGDQPIVDNSITVPTVMAAQDGWLVVHQNTPDNKPGPVIGHTAVKAGVNMNVKISLDPAPKPGDKVWAMLHIDVGQKGAYEFPGPDAPVIQNGDIVMKQISIAGASTGGAESQGTASSPAYGTTPAALPNTGENDFASPWLLPAAAGVLFLLCGFILIGGSRTSRRG